MLDAVQEVPALVGATTAPLFEVENALVRSRADMQRRQGVYTGCIIKGQRAQVLPTINPLSGLLTLLSGVISGVNTALAQLTGYNVFGGAVVGASVSVIAVARSDVPAT